MDRISLLGLELDARVGVYAHEEGILQRLTLDVVAEVDRVPSSDRLEETVDYDRIAAICREVVDAGHHRLIETIATRVAEKVLASDARILRVAVGVEKPGAVPGARTVRVDVVRAPSDAL